MKLFWLKGRNMMSTFVILLLNKFTNRQRNLEEFNIMEKSTCVNQILFLMNVKKPGSQTAPAIVKRIVLLRRTGFAGC